MMDMPLRYTVVCAGVDVPILVCRMLSYAQQTVGDILGQRLPADAEVAWILSYILVPGALCHTLHIISCECQGCGYVQSLMPGWACF
jgi:hypothetical protein